MKTTAVQEVAAAVQNPALYRQFNEAEYERMTALGRELTGTGILHVNSTAKGGGVAELLSSQVPLERGLGLNSRWMTIEPKNMAFFDVTKKLHNLLQGADGNLSEEELEIYRHESERFRGGIQEYLAGEPVDIITAHDPQPLTAIAGLTTSAKKILRMHVDLCEPNQATVTWLCQEAEAYGQIIASREKCIPACLPGDKVTAIAPAIDPLAKKNQLMEKETADEILARHGIDPNRPVISQISRFDVWKDQVGVVQAYRHAKQAVPELQLVLVGFLQADDDPEAKEYLERTRQAAGDDGDVHVFSDLVQIAGTTNAEFVRAVQTGSDVVLQKSLKEGFGLTVTEAMWKGKAVIGGNVGGITLQIEQEKNGWLTNNGPETTEALVTLLTDAPLRERLGAAARETVRARFLLPRYLRENLEVYTRLV